ANKRLFEETGLAIKFFQCALDNALDHGGRLAGPGGLRTVNRPLPLPLGLRDLVTSHVTRVSRSDLHSEVLHQALKLFGARDKVGLAVYLDQNPDFPAPVDVGAHRTLRSHAPSFLGRGGQPLLPQEDDGLFDIPATLGQGPLAIDDSSPGTLTQLFDLGQGAALAAHAVPPSIAAAPSDGATTATCSCTSP